MAISARHAFVAAVVAVVGAAVVAGLMIVGSPARERMRRMDYRRVQDLVEIMRAVNWYWARHRALPPSLDPLLESPQTPVTNHDPLGRLYDFNVIGPKTYEVCADFQIDSAGNDSEAYGRFWSHGPGHHCFRLDVDQTQR